MIDVKRQGWDCLCCCIMRNLLCIHVLYCCFANIRSLFLGRRIFATGFRTGERKRRVETDWCHQCRCKSKNVGALDCRKCRKSYCVRCARRWYPSIEDESFQESCPVCRNICNCGKCLQIASKIKDLEMVEEVFYFSTYTIRVLLPSLEKIVAESPDHVVTELLGRARAVVAVLNTRIPVVRACSCVTSGEGSQNTLKAASREPGDDNYLYYPLGSEIYISDVEHFQFHFSRGQPVIVQSVRSRTFEFSWDPKVLNRALKLYRKKSNSCLDVMVMNCSSWHEKKITMKEFLKGYSDKKDILNLEEWPLPNTFQERLPRHYADAVRCLPLKQYTHPVAGRLNMPAKLPYLYVGPKISIHYGPRGVQRNLNSITKLKCTFSDRIYILMHVGDYKPQASTSTQGLQDTEGVTRWDVFRKQDIPKLEGYLRKHDQELSSVHPHHEIFNPMFGKYFLTMSQKMKLKHELDIEPWTFDQKLGEAVIIPAGCIYQSEKLKPCVQLAFDFISPEFLADSELIDVLRSFGHNPPLRFKDLAKELIIHAIEAAIQELESIE